MRDESGILFLFLFFSISVRNLSSFKLPQHAQNMDPGERDKEENRTMIIGWGGTIRFHDPLNDKQKTTNMF